MSHLAIDLGASSGRASLVALENDKLSVREIRRFDNTPVKLGDRFHWDLPRILHEVKQAISLAHRESSGALRSFGVDTWGLDFGLLDASGELLANPYHYRDSGTQSIRPTVWERVPRREMFYRTGIQDLPVNTIYQLAALAESRPWILETAHTLLMTPDLIRYFLTGEQTSEYTIATTSELVGVDTRDWDRELIDRCGIPAEIFPAMVEAGTVQGSTSTQLTDELDIPSIPVVAVAEHDTASAVLTIEDPHNRAFLSLGTWGLLGVMLEEPLVNEEVLNANLTNEGGAGGQYRFLKNIMGMWLLERCLTKWQTARSPAELTALLDAAQAVPATRSIVDPDDPRYIDPIDMPAAIQEHCRETSQPIPESPPEIARCIVDSLALKSRIVFRRIEAVIGRSLSGMQVVGGGSRNSLFCQSLADATGKPVWAGPAEATTIGNGLVQMMAMGNIATTGEGRRLLAQSNDMTHYEPKNGSQWDSAHHNHNARFEPAGNSFGETAGQ